MRSLEAARPSLGMPIRTAEVEEEQKEPDAQLNAVSEIFNMVVADIARAEPTAAVAKEDEKSQ